MHRTPLHQFHLDAGAKMVEFAGWEMPIMYRSVHDEHRQVRTSGGLFDVSHMGRVRIHGRHARKFLERICSRRISDMDAGQCRYSLICNADGGVRDDVLVYRMDDDDFMVVVNASNRERILAHFEKNRADMVLTIDDRTLQTAMVAIQGPHVMEIIGKFSREIPTLKRYRFAVKNLLVMKVIVSRTGYTGEDGVEAILPGAAIGMAMKLMLKDMDPHSDDSPIRPAGLGARDTLRLEAGMPLYGHELGEDINALSCGVDFAISLDKTEEKDGENFIGQDALVRTRDAGGPETKLVGIEVEGKRTARQGMPILVGGEPSGAVSSGCLSPTLDKSIAMGFVKSAQAETGTEVSIDAGRATLAGRIVPMPFYKAPKN